MNNPLIKNFEWYAIKNSFLFNDYHFIAFKENCFCLFYLIKNTEGNLNHLWRFLNRTFLSFELSSFGIYEGVKLFLYLLQTHSCLVLTIYSILPLSFKIKSELKKKQRSKQSN